MPEGFDPYLKWLGIRDQSGPLNHYRLLGLELFEPDIGVISGAAARQMRHVKTFLTGPHAAECRRLLKELNNARDVLTDPDLKKGYDQNLKKVLASLAQPSSAPIVVDKEGNTSGPKIDVGNLADVGSATPSAPRIQLRPARRKKSAWGDAIGWVLGAVGAVVFAYVILNTDVIDRIKGNHRPQAQQDLEHQPKVDADNRLADDAVNVSGGLPENNSDSSDKVANPDAAAESGEVSQAEVSTENNSSNNPTTRTDPIDTFDVPDDSANVTEKFSVPDQELIKNARKKLLSLYKPQISGNDLNAKRLLSKSLLVASRKESDLAKRYAMLEIALEMAGESGAMDLVLEAAESKERKFKIDFWDTLMPPTKMAINVNKDFETISHAIDNLLSRCRKEGRFELASTISATAAKSVRKQNDVLQNDMLVRFSKEMKKLEALKRSYLAITDNATAESDATKLSAKDKLVAGKYFCFCENDWKTGLGLLQESSDSALASMAKMDLESNAGNRIEIAEAWIELGQKSKYKGVDRRCFCERAVELLSGEGGGVAQTQSLVNQAKQQVQVVKKFVLAPNNSDRKIVFDVRGPATFDSAVGNLMRQRGHSIQLGLGQQVRTLPLRFREGSYLATTRDRKVNIKIRLMDNGIAEMRLYNAASNNLLNIIYGN